MTPQTIITEARYVLNDTTTDYRQSDTEMLEYVTRVLDDAASARPDLFDAVDTHTCVHGAEQTLAFNRVLQFQEVVRVLNGDAVLPVSRQSLDAFKPSWYRDTTASAVNWMPHPADPKRFYVYPPSPVLQKLVVRFTQGHAAVGLTDTITLSDKYRSALVDGVVAYAESKDDEHVLSQRAQAARASFYEKMKG